MMTTASDNVKLRTATEADRPAIADLNTRAFGQPDEARIVADLEKAGDVLLQIVAEQDGRIVGHILFYPLGVRGKLGAVGLGPMSVDPSLQRSGVGSKLVRAGLNMLQTSGAPIVFVLGHETYYPRFGFSVDAAEEFETPLKGPHFMAVRMRHGPPMSGELIFPEAFGVK
jgi:putative acetyltransferase